jgi:hypothetical protein
METSANNNSKPNKHIVAFLLTKEGKEVVQKVESLLRESKNGYETLGTIGTKMKKDKPKMKKYHIKLLDFVEVAFTVVKRKDDILVYRKQEDTKEIKQGTEEKIKIKEQPEGTVTRIFTMTTCETYEIVTRSRHDWRLMLSISYLIVWNLQLQSHTSHTIDCCT